MSAQAPPRDVQPSPTYGAEWSVDCPTCGCYDCDGEADAKARAGWCRTFGHGDARARKEADY